MSFDSLGLSANILRAVADEGYTVPTPIQRDAIPHILAGADLLGSAQTGTGKTAAFALPILDRLVAARPADGDRRRPIRALVLSPTRELASQISESFRTYGRHSGLKQTVIFGGVKQHGQVRALKGRVDILVATPGRLLDLMNQGFVKLDDVSILVLDEADRMLDMGFIHDIRTICSQAPKARQTLMFSATMPREIRILADTLLTKPVSIQVAPTATPAERIEQSVYYVEKRNKPQLLTHFLQQSGTFRTLVFTRTKHGADKVVRDLVKSGIRAEAIHGNKTQAARQRALANFKSAKPPVLVATDVASRGIDVDAISYVVNFDLPVDAETYVHRIGRTARAGATGAAVSFCDRDERGMLRSIERLMKLSLRIQADHPFPEARGTSHQAEPAAEGQGERPRSARPAYGKPAYGKPKFGGDRARPAGKSFGGKPFARKRSNNGSTIPKSEVKAAAAGGIVAAPVDGQPAGRKPFGAPRVSAHTAGQPAGRPTFGGKPKPKGKRPFAAARP